MILASPCMLGSHVQYFTHTRCRRRQRSSVSSVGRLRLPHRNHDGLAYGELKRNRKMAARGRGGT